MLVNSNKISSNCKCKYTEYTMYCKCKYTEYTMYCRSYYLLIFKSIKYLRLDSGAFKNIPRICFKLNCRFNIMQQFLNVQTLLMGLIVFITS